MSQEMYEERNGQMAFPVSGLNDKAKEAYLDRLRREKGEAFEDSVCATCIRHGDCLVWDMHMLYNYDECNKKDSLLHKMIPRDEDGFSRTCNFFKSLGE